MPKISKPGLPQDTEWADETVTWFEAWRNSSRTDSWDAIQWQYMFDTALVHSSVWGAGNFAMLGELRTRLTIMGITFDPPPKIEMTGKKEATPLDRAKRKRAAKASNKS